MKSRTAALVWEIWRQHRSTVAAIAGLTVMARLVVRSVSWQGLAGI